MKLQDAIQKECLEYQTEKEESKPSEPLSFMDTCLQNLHVNDDSSKRDTRQSERNAVPNSSLVIAPASDDSNKRRVSFAVA